MAAWSSFKIEGELVGSSQSEDQRRLQTTEEFEKKNKDEEVKKEKHCPNIVRRWWLQSKDYRRKIDHGQRLPKVS